MKTIRQIISEYQDELASKQELQPDRAAKILNELSALTGNVNDQIRTTDIAYNKVLLDFLDSEEKANRAKIKAQTSPEYEEARIAKDTKELVTEMTRGLKYYLRAKSEELRESYNN